MPIDEKSRATKKAERRKKPSDEKRDRQEKHISQKRSYRISMECDECGYDPGSAPVPGYTATSLINKIQKKRMELQDQLIEHAYSGPDGHKLSDNDVIRYSAMVEVLKAVLQ